MTIKNTLRFLLCMVFTIMLMFMSWILLTPEAHFLINKMGLFMVALFGAIMLLEDK